MSFILRPYQSDIVNQTSHAKGSVLVELPTGGGKSVIAKHIIENEVAKGGTALIVAPKLNLLEQLANTFSELDPQIIHGAKDYDEEHHTFVSTLQTAHKRQLGFTPTLIVIDEIHYGFTGMMLKKLLDGFNGKVVGLSATPYDKQGKPLEGFKKHINKYDLNYMISNQYLVPILSYQPVKVNLKDVKMTAGDYNIGDLEQKFGNIESVMQVVDATKAKILERHKTLVFCITIRHAEIMAQAYTDAGVPALAIHSNLSGDERAAVMSKFISGEVKVLTNVDVLTTGFDHPATDLIVMARATKSQNLYKQMVGRALRPSPGKADAVMLDCAGVIGNLGMPTAPIVPRAVRDTGATAAECAECASTRVYRRLVDNVAYKVCAECGHKAEIESDEGYMCEACDMTYGNNATFEAVNGKLMLKCACGHDTVISEATTHEELEIIYDKTLVTILQKKVISGYLTWLIDKYDVEFTMREEVQHQIRLILANIAESPQRLNLYDMETVNKFDGWKLLIETREKPREVKNKPVFDAVKSVGGDTDLYYRIVDRIAESSMSDAHLSKAVCTRLHNLHNSGKQISSIISFITWLEGQQRVA